MSLSSAPAMGYHLTFGDHELSSKLHAKLFLEGTIDVYGMNSSYYQPYHLNYVMWQKLWSGGRSWIWLWIRKKKTMARVIWDWEAVPCSFRNLYATLPNVLNKHRLIQSFICSSFRFKEGVGRFFFTKTNIAMENNHFFMGKSTINGHVQ